MASPTSPLSGILNTVSGVFSSIGQGLTGQVQSAADTATQAFYVIAGELAVIIVLLFGIFLKRSSR